MNENFILTLQRLIAERPEGVQQLLFNYGVSKQATPQVIMDAYTLFKKPFLVRLFEVLSEKTSNWSVSELWGSSQTEPTSPAGNVEAGNQYGGFEKWFDKGLGALGTIGSFVNVVKNPTSPTVQATPAEAAIVEQQAKQKQTYVIIGIVIIVVLFAILIFKKPKS